MKFFPTSLTTRQGFVRVTDSARLKEVETAMVSLATSRGAQTRIHSSGMKDGIPFIELVSDSGNDEEIVTRVQFDDFKGWDIWSAEVRDDVNLTFFRS